MRSIKAILAGSVFIIVAILLLQLVYIFIAVMFAGGYVTATVANMGARMKMLLPCRRADQRWRHALSHSGEFRYHNDRYRCFHISLDGNHQWRHVLAEDERITLV